MSDGLIDHPAPQADGFENNRQRVGQGLAIMGSVGGNVSVIVGMEEPASEKVFQPAFREGPYPRGDVEERLRGFTEPPSYARCEEILGRGVLLLRAETGTGSTTAAFALLAARHGADGIAGLDPSGDLTTWELKPGRGHLVQGLPQERAKSLGEVQLMSLSARLRDMSASLVVIVGEEVSLPADTGAWQAVHRPPSPCDVAEAHLRARARAGTITTDQLSETLAALTAPEFTAYLRASRLPGLGADAAEELREAVTTGRPAATALENLRLGSLPAARKALESAAGSADDLALIAAVALLEEQDRTVIEQLAAKLRPLFRERAGGDVPAHDRTAQPDLLGPAFDKRLAKIGARALPPRVASGYRHRYRVQPVVFHGRHRAEAVLRQLWLEYEGTAPILREGLRVLSYQPGVDLASGRAIGRVLAHATGPAVLREVQEFASADVRWRRRLAAYALGEFAQHAELAAAAHEQLRQWSRQRDVNLRCTVAETCAGSYGLARPEAAMHLLRNVLDGPDDRLEGRLRTAVSFALGVLLKEEANRPLVLAWLVTWLTAEGGTLHHSYAAFAIESLCRTGFPEFNRSGTQKVSLADVLADHRYRALDLVATALDEPATYGAMAEGLSDIGRDAALRRRVDLDGFLGELAKSADGRRGVIRFLLTRYRQRSTIATERKVS
ncbi:hypothetical protein [Streptomyces sclerotialus]|uniref:hypothetical protein n=1 Tax=Streptomyces sclerotialus TaxID=1957 RepID=UPI00068E685A